MHPERHHRIVKLIALASLVLTAAPAMAQWTGKGEAGLAFASGNSDSKSGNARLRVAREVEKWEHQASLAGNYVSDDAGTTSQRLELAGQSRYNFSPRTFWFGGGRVEDDRFSGFEYQATLSTGLGRKFIDSDITKLSGQVGVGYKVSETSPSIDPDTLLPVPGDRDDNAALVGTVDYTHELTGNTTLYDKFSLEAVADNTFLQNEIGIAVKMTDRLALAVGLAVRHNTDPPAGFENTDTLTTLNLAYEVK